MQSLQEKSRLCGRTENLQNVLGSSSAPLRSGESLPSALLAAYFYGRCRLAAFMNMTVFWFPLHIFVFFFPSQLGFCCTHCLLPPLSHQSSQPPLPVNAVKTLKISPFLHSLVFLSFSPLSSFQWYCARIRAWLHLYTLGMMTSEPIDFLLQNWCKILLISCIFGTTLFLTPLS